MSAQLLQITYLQNLFQEYTRLQDRKQELQNATAQIIAINTALVELLDDAQKIVDMYNTKNGTSYTLAEMRKRLISPGE